MKLWQFDPADRTQLRLDTTSAPFTTDAGRPSVEAVVVVCRRTRAGAAGALVHGSVVELPASGGIELLVLDGGFSEGGEVFDRSVLAAAARQGIAAGCHWSRGLPRLGKNRPSRRGPDRISSRLVTNRHVTILPDNNARPALSGKII